MTHAERRMLEALSLRGPCRASTLGADLYGGGKYPRAYARPAANVLCRLTRRGFAVLYYTRQGKLWTITDVGTVALKTHGEVVDAEA